MSGYGAEQPYGVGLYKGDTSEVIDYGAKARGLLVEQFEDSPKMQGMVRAVLTELQEVQLSDTNHLSSFDIEVATGALLDNIGDIVGVSRGGKTDSEYRTELYYSIYINMSSGQIDAVVSFASNITGGYVVAREVPPAKLYIGIAENSVENYDKAFELIDSVAGGGVKVVGGVEQKGLILITTEPTMANAPKTGVLSESNYSLSEPVEGKLIEGIIY